MDSPNENSDSLPGIPPTAAVRMRSTRRAKENLISQESAKLINRQTKQPLKSPSGKGAASPCQSPEFYVHDPKRHKAPTVRVSKTGLNSLRTQIKCATTQTNLGDLTMNTICEKLKEYEPIIKAEKTKQELLHVQMRNEIQSKLRSIDYMIKEIEWLKTDCDRLVNTYSHVSIDEDQLEKTWRSNMAAVMDYNDLEAASSIPNVHRKYFCLKSEKEAKSLIQEIDNTVTLLEGFKYSTILKLNERSRSVYKHKHRNAHGDSSSKQSASQKTDLENNTEGYHFTKHYRSLDSFDEEEQQ